MWEGANWENEIDRDVAPFQDLDCIQPKEEPQDEEQPWFRSIVNTVRKYKKGLFGDDSSTCIRKQRLLDYTVPPNYKFVLAKHSDGFYRPASIMGRSKKMQLFILYFYHNRRCCYVKPKDLLIKHGNLLERKVCFCQDGRRMKAKVYGNNSPANHGFPSLFFLKKRSSWYTVDFKNILLTRKQVNQMYFQSPNRRNSVDSNTKSKTCVEPCSN